MQYFLKNILCAFLVICLVNCSSHKQIKFMNSELSNEQLNHVLLAQEASDILLEDTAIIHGYFLIDQDITEQDKLGAELIKILQTKGFAVINTTNDEKIKKITEETPNINTLNYEVFSVYDNGKNGFIIKLLVDKKVKYTRVYFIDGDSLKPLNYWLKQELVNE